MWRFIHDPFTAQNTSMLPPFISTSSSSLQLSRIRPFDLFHLRINSKAMKSFKHFVGLFVQWIVSPQSLDVHKAARRWQTRTDVRVPSWTRSPVRSVQTSQTAKLQSSAFFVSRKLFYFLKISEVRIMYKFITVSLPTTSEGSNSSLPYVSNTSII
jgi:hypothetical protein